MRTHYKLPDLSRKPVGSIHSDFQVWHAMQTFETGRSEFDFHSYDLNEYYSLANARYRQDFLEEMLSPHIRPSIDELSKGIPSRMIEQVVEPEPNFYRDIDEDELIRRQINLVKRILLIPDVFEKATQLPGTSRAAQDIRAFSSEVRTDLDYFVKVTAKYRKDKQFADEECLDMRWANRVLDRIAYAIPRLRELTELKNQLRRFRNLAVPYETKVNGEKLPFCKPVLLDPEERRGFIREAYNPAHFKFLRKSRYGYNSNFRKGDILKLNVPNDIYWGEDARATYIHGPNSQGKSVYGDTAALNIHLAMNGAFCFAREAELAFPDRLFPCFDLGSILGAGHFEHGGRKVRYMLKRVTRNSIVFMDEVGSGTEPEGERLVARGLGDNLLKYGVTFFAITHDKRSWIHNAKKKNVRALRVADECDKARRYKVWEGIAPDGYALTKARKMKIDPDSVNHILSERLGR